ncbi:MAG TPA: NAD-dependent epimerase/dehydratase family protein [Burkholderiales bacterium]|nr:NAD-dependent epimerase/dehydratase family protein [Burkholderiales bacterium]
MGRTLITGASGFVGRALVDDLAAAGRSVRAAMRQPADVFARSVEVVAVSDLTRPVEWRALLKDVDTVVHLAGIAHAGPEIADDVYDKVNRLATAELAQAARTAGIRRLVFVSSIRAQAGPSSSADLRETDLPNPTDAYGRSKLAAEEAVRQSGVPFAILRPVLVYGPGVRGNMARLLQLAQKPWPLPLGLCRNRRSLLDRRNLLSAIHLALQAPATVGETYIVADPAPLTLAEIVTALRAGMGRPPRLIPVPPSLIALALHTAGRADQWQRLGGTQVADPSKLILAGWQPIVATRAGLAELAEHIAQELLPP